MPHFQWRTNTYRSMSVIYTYIGLTRISRCHALTSGPPGGYWTIPPSLPSTRRRSPFQRRDPAWRLPCREGTHPEHGSPFLRALRRHTVLWWVLLGICKVSFCRCIHERTNKRWRLWAGNPEEQHGGVWRGKRWISFSWLFFSLLISSTIFFRLAHLLCLSYCPCLWMVVVEDAKRKESEKWNCWTTTLLCSLISESSKFLIHIRRTLKTPDKGLNWPKKAYNMVRFAHLCQCTRW